MNSTKWINEPGCDLATGWDGYYLDGQHPTGHPMRVIVSRSMRDPRHVRYSSTVDGSEHFAGEVGHPVERDGLPSELNAIWDKCFNTPSAHRDNLKPHSP